MRKITSIVATLAFEVLEATSQPDGTQFSAVFDLAAGECTIAFGRKFDKRHRFSCLGARLPAEVGP